MSAWLIIFVGVIYLLIAADLLRKGQVGLSVAFFGYAFSNVGLYLASRSAA